MPAPAGARRRRCRNSDAAPISAASRTEGFDVPARPLRLQPPVYVDTLFSLS
jgi:hypothetical protein